MKKLVMMLALVALLGGCASAPEQTKEVNETNEVTEEKVVVEDATEKDGAETEVVKPSYQLEKDHYIDEAANINIEYLMMTGFEGELTQDYINQSLTKIIDFYSNNDFYEQVTIRSEIWMMTDKRISVVYSGSVTLSGGKSVEVWQPVNIDVDSSNEITFGNLFNDVEAVREMIGEAVVAQGIAQFFETEGIRIHMDETNIYFAYMPLDDSATEFIKVSLSREALAPYLNEAFGNHPAS